MHSCRHCWNLLRHLGTTNPMHGIRMQVKTNAINAKFLRTSKQPVDEQYRRQVRHQLQQVRSTSTPTSQWFGPSTNKETDVANEAMQLGKAVGEDGIYLKFLYTLGPLAQKLMIQLFTNILETNEIPPMWREDKAITT